MNDDGLTAIIKRENTAIKSRDRTHRMEQQGLVAKDLEPYIGSSGRVSDVLNRRRSLSLRMVKRLHEGLKIPYESLFSQVG